MTTELVDTLADELEAQADGLSVIIGMVEVVAPSTLVGMLRLQEKSARAALKSLEDQG